MLEAQNMLSLATGQLKINGIGNNHQSNSGSSLEGENGIERYNSMPISKDMNHMSKTLDELANGKTLILMYNNIFYMWFLFLIEIYFDRIFLIKRLFFFCFRFSHDQRRIEPGSSNVNDG